MEGSRGSRRLHDPDLIISPQERALGLKTDLHGIDSYSSDFIHVSYHLTKRFLVDPQASATASSLHSVNIQIQTFSCVLLAQMFVSSNLTT